MSGRLRHRVLLAVLLALLAAISAVLLSARERGQASAPAAASPFAGPTMPPHLRAANFSLLDENGHRVTLSRLRGKVVVLTFIHSLCHDACPFMVEQIKGALNDIPNAGRQVAAIGVSVAPGEDTPGNRRHFLQQHEMSGRLAFVNGPRAVLSRVWHQYGMQPVQGNIDHSTYVLLIDRRGFERVGFPADHLTPEDLAHDIGVLERGRV